MLKHVVMSGFLVLGSAWAIACGGDDDAGGLGDCPPDSAALQATGRQLVATRCANCHASGLSGNQRNGAPVGLDFDVLATVRTEAESIYDEIAEGAMPPSAALASSDQEAVRVWLACDAPQ